MELLAHAQKTKTLPLARVAQTSCTPSKCSGERPSELFGDVQLGKLAFPPWLILAARLGRSPCVCPA
jgi:hypothetical protein